MPRQGIEPSCYLLEFSVSPGGARQGEVYAHGTLDGLRNLIEQRDDPCGIDPYLVMWYGAVLHLWVVRGGVIVEGIDLHPQLRTGDPRFDISLARLLSLREDDDALWSDAQELVGAYDFESLSALPVLTRLFELHDRSAGGAEPDAVAELARLRHRIGSGDAPEPASDAPAVERLDLDWDAVASTVAPLAGPLLAVGGVTVTWAPDAVQHPDSYLTDALRYGAVTLYAGLNDLEQGDDEFLYAEDRDE